MSRYRFNPDEGSTHNMALATIGHDKIVLEVGCANGFMSERLTRQGCSVVGVEVDPTVATQARAYCDAVIVADADALEQLPYEHGHFDVLLFGDVLEHLRAPERLLVALRPYLKTDGLLVCSVPNVAYCYQRLALLAGRWDYTNEGTLDRTHLRFFTRKTARLLVEQSGYRIERARVYARVPILRRFRNFAPAAMLERALGNLIPNLFGYQFFIEARVDGASS